MPVLWNAPKKQPDLDWIWIGIHLTQVRTCTASIDGFEEIAAYDDGPSNVKALRGLISKEFRRDWQVALVFEQAFYRTIVLGPRSTTINTSFQELGLGLILDWR